MEMQTPKPLNDLLRATSRSFYLTLRVLPAAVRPQIGLAYLLARTTDTIADTEILPVAQRLDALQKFRERILGQTSAPLNFSELAQAAGFARGKIVAGKSRRRAWRRCKTFRADDQKLIRDVLATITSGQELDLRRFGSLSPTESRPAGQQIIALETAAELDDYTYRVAGCVGEFWTKICRAHLFPQREAGRKTIHHRRHPVRQRLAAREHFARPAGGFEKLAAAICRRNGWNEANLFPETLLSPANGNEISAAVPRISRQGGIASARRLALHEHAAVRAIPRAAGVRVAGFDRRADD